MLYLCGIKLYTIIMKNIPKEPFKQENCCSPMGQVKRHVDCKGCDRKPCNFYEKLKEYFKNTPREKVLEDWNKSAHLDNIGITVDKFIEYNSNEKAEQGNTIDFDSYAENEQEPPERQLVYNSVTCLDCGETLVSSYTHDYKTCNCSQRTMVDGGLSYARFGGKDLNKVQKNHLYSDSPHEKIREVFARGSRGKSGKESLTYILLKDIDDDYLKSIIEYEQKNRPDNPLIKVYKNEQEFRKNN